MAASGLKKPPSFSSNGVSTSSSSFKHIYDDVFAAPPHSKLKSTSFIDDDYAEMFGSSKSNNGCWNISYSSIPVLDLPPTTELRVRGVSGVTTVSGERGGGVDYGGVFGDVSLSLPDGEELFEQFKKKAKTSSRTITIPRSGRQPSEAIRPDISRQFQDGQSPASGFPQSLDNVRQFEHNNYDITTRSGELKITARPRDTSGFTSSLDEAGPCQKSLPSEAPVIKNDTNLCQDVNLAKKQGRHSRHTSSDLGAREQNGEYDSGFKNVKHGVHSKHASLDLGADEQNGDHYTDFQRASVLSGSSRSGELKEATRPHDTSGSTYSLDEAEPCQKSLPNKATVIKEDTNLCQDVNLAKTEGKHSRHTSSDLGANEQNGEHDSGFQKAKKQGVNSWHTSLDLGANEQNDDHDTGFQRASVLSGSNSVGTSHNTCQPSTAQTNGISKPFETTKHSEYKNNTMGINRTSEATIVADVHVTPVSNLSTGTPFLKDDTQTDMDVTLATKQGTHSRITCSELGENKQNNERDAGSQKASLLSGSVLLDTSCNTCETGTVAGPSMVVSDDPEAAIDFNFAKKKGRHSRMTSLDLGDQKHSQKCDAGLQQRPRFGSSYSFDASHDPCTAHIKMQPSKMAPSSSLHQFFPMESHYKISENASCRSFESNLFRGVKGSLPSLDDQLDMNSAAAVSAAALQRAIEEAEMRIRSAKEFLKREGQGSRKLRFKDTLKVKVVKGEELLDEMNKFQPAKIRGNCSLVDVEMQTCSVPEKQSVSEKAQPTPVYERQTEFVEDEPVIEDQNKFAKDEEHIEVKTGNTSNLMDEGDKREGVEWEAAKHLNQLISGVKNKIASFMAWQTETEKKEESKVTEGTTKSQQQTEVGDPDLKDLEAFEIRGAEKNQDLTHCAGETIPGESEVGLASDGVVQDENELIEGNTVERVKAGNKEDSDPDVGGPTSANFMFFAFRNERVCDPQEEEKKGCQESRELENDSEQEQVMNELQDEQLQGQLEERNGEKLDDICMARDSVRQGHMYNHGVLSYEEINEFVEESYSLVGHDREELTHEEDNKRALDEECGTEPTDNSQCPENTAGRIQENGGCEERERAKEAENQQENVQILEKINLGGEIEKSIGAADRKDGCQETEMDQSQTYHIDRVAGQIYKLEEIRRDESLADNFEEASVEVAEKASCITAAEDEHEQIESDLFEPTTEEVADIASCIAAAEDEHRQTEAGEVEEFAEQVASFAVAEEECKQTGEACGNGGSSPRVEEAVSSDEESESMVEITDSSSEPELEEENPVIARKASELIGEDSVVSSVITETTIELDGIMEDVDGTNETLQFQNCVLHDCQSDVSSGKEDFDVKVMESDSEDNLEHQTDNVHGSAETLNMGKADIVCDQEAQMSGVEAVPRRRRWFENGGKVGAAEIPSILEGDKIGLEIDQEILDDSDLAGSVEVHTDKPDSATAFTAGKVADAAVNQDNSRINVEATPKRRRWFVKRGEEGLPEPPPLFEGVKVTLEEPRETVNVSLRHSISDNHLEKLSAETRESVDTVLGDAATNGVRDKQSVEAAPRRKRWFESGDMVGLAQQLRTNEDAEITLETDQQSNSHGDVQKHSKMDSMPTFQETEDEHSKVDPMNEQSTRLDEVSRREKEKEKERIAVERAIREARERAFADARERARRDAAERPNVEARQRAAAGTQERLGKVSTEARSSSDKASVEAKLRVERAAVERATAEARERALQKAFSEKASHRSREQDTNFQSSSSYSRSDTSNKGEKFDGVESALRCKAQLERQSRTMERAAKALEEKNRRDLLAQKEQAAKNMLADSLDAEVKRWSSGKEGNLRVLLSTLQYILGPESGWQAVSLTDLMAATAVRKAYKKATLCVHPDKLQQRGATIQQKYICEKVFDLLKEAWSKLNPDER